MKGIPTGNTVNKMKNINKKIYLKYLIDIQ